MADLDQAGGPSAMKSINLSQCLCHTRGISEKLTRFTDSSWDSLKNAALEREDEIYHSLKDLLNGDPCGVYHRCCYQSYTNKEHILRTKRQRQSVWSEESPDSPPPKRIAREPPKPKSTLCIICKENRYDRRNKKQFMPLRQCMTFEAGQNLLRAAERKNDEHVLCELQGIDPIANEVHYHHVCYVRYVKTKKTEAVPDPYENAFKVIAESVERTVITDHETMKMSKLREAYISALSSFGINAPKYRTEKLKKRLIKHFGQDISFCHPQNRQDADIVYYTGIPKGTLVEAAETQDPDTDLSGDEAKSKSDELDTVNTSDLYHVAKYLRSALKKTDSQMPEAPSALDLTTEKISLPTVVYNFLLWLIAEETEHDDITCQPVTTKRDIERKVLSIGQDLLYNVSRGRTKTPKHVSLAMTVKNLTGSSQVVSLLNRFGHTVSYNELLHIESEIASKEISRTQEGVLIPENIQPQTFTSLCWDNNDINEQTLSGSDTTHCTNGILVQRRTHTCATPPKEAGMANPQNNPPLASLGRPISFQTGKRLGPGIMAIDIELLKTPMEGIFTEPKRMDFGWVLMRLPGDDLFNLPDEHHQNTPGKKKFQYFEIHYQIIHV